MPQKLHPRISTVRSPQSPQRSPAGRVRIVRDALRLLPPGNDLPGRLHIPHDQRTRRPQRPNPPLPVPPLPNAIRRQAGNAPPRPKRPPEQETSRTERPRISQIPLHAVRQAIPAKAPPGRAHQLAQRRPQVRLRVRTLVLAKVRPEPALPNQAREPEGPHLRRVSENVRPVGAPQTSRVDSLER
uniref:(northern house mosquito) hypothetical protein n=1 Tax=Culex pipiens TaxID=7175 RepID=A0A8D8BJ51_CULPI